LTGEQKHGPEKRGPRRREGWDAWRGKRWCPWFPWNRPLAGQCAEGGRQCRPRRQQVPPTLAPVSSAANQTLVLDTPPRSPLVPPLAAVVAAGEGMSHASVGPALPLRDPPFISALAAMEHSEWHLGSPLSPGLWYSMWWLLASSTPPVECMCRGRCSSPDSISHLVIPPIVLTPGVEETYACQSSSGRQIPALAYPRSHGICHDFAASWTTAPLRHRRLQRCRLF